MAGSGIFAFAKGIIQAFTRSGVGKEVDDLREDTRRAFQPMVATTVEEFTDVALADVDAIVTDLASATAAVELEGAALDGVVGEGDMTPPRNVTVTCDDSAATWAGNVTVEGWVLVPNTGKGASYVEQAVSEDIALTNNATTAGAKMFTRVESVSVPAQNDANGTYSVGFGPKLGFAQEVKSRVGALRIKMENEDGTIITESGTLSGTYTDAATSPPHGAVVPADTPDGSKDYAYEYEYTPKN